jgi:hypothetical protein
MYDQSQSSASLELLTSTVLWPLLLAIAVSLLGAWAGGKRHWLLPTAVVAGAALGISLVHTTMQFPPARSVDRFLPLLLLAWAVATLVTPRLSSVMQRGGVAAAVIMTGMLWTLWPLLARWPWLEIAVQLLAGGAVWGWLYWLSGQLPESNAGSSALLAPLAMTAPVVALDGSLLVGQFAGVLAASLGGWWLISLWRGPLAMGRAGAAFLAFALGALLLLAHHYAGLDWLAALLLASSPVPVLLLQGLLGNWPSLVQRVAGGLLAVLPGVVALWLIWPEESLY